MNKVLTNSEIMQNLTINQVDVLMSQAKVRVLLQGRQSAKTQTLCTIIYKEALEKVIEVLIVACTHKQVKENLFRRLISGNDPFFKKEVIKSINRTEMTVELHNGSRLSFAGTENVDALLGRTVDLLIMDEYQSMDKEVLMKLQPMVAARYGNMVIAGTVRGFNHMYDAYWKGAKENPERSKGWRSWRIPTANSGTPAGTPDAIQMAKASISKQQYEQEYNCSPTSLKGAVYAVYDTELNLSTAILDKQLGLHIGLDFNVGFMLAVVFQLIVKDKVRPDGTKYRLQEVHVIEEIPIENGNTQLMANTLANRYTLWKGRTTVYPDPAGNSRKTSAILNSTDHTILRNAGFNLKFHPKHPEINDRVNSVNAMLCNANDERRLFVNRNCKHLIKALVGQVYDSSGKPLKGAGDVDDLSGPNDSLGYAIEYLFPITGTSSGVTNMYGYKQ